LEIITLVGSSNCGKTMTLKTLIFKVLDSKGQLNYNRPKYIKGVNFLSKNNMSFLRNEFHQEFKKAPRDLTAKFDFNGKTVLITTAGDSLDYIQSIYERNAPCDIFICAAHNNKNMLSYLQGLGNVTIIPQAKIQLVDDKGIMNNAILQRNKNVSNSIFQII
jgi:ABC-type oligopeptide transport system ATPase subunit